MAGAGWPSLCLSSARALLLVVVFIIVSAHVAEGRRCYWCGPLAEQVHRSRRAPPCEGEGRHITVCEPGYDHCAVVATSPPYMESRFCVKLYQDECYPLFCNSTKTWKMTCPCRGDLCNGANTEREDDAFSALERLLTKTHSHIKKRTPTLQLTGNRKGRIVNPNPQDEQALPIEEEKDTQDNIKLDQNTEIITESNTASTNNQPIPSEKEESENDTMNQSANEELELDNGAKPTSTAMIEIDIIQRPTTYHQESITNQTTIHEVDIQADEPMQNDKQGEVHKHLEDKDEGHKEEHEPEESKQDESTTDAQKLHPSDVTIATSLSPPTIATIHSEDKMEPNESTAVDSVQKGETQTESIEQIPQISQTKVEVRVPTTEGVVAITPTTATYAITGHTVVAITTQSSKDKKNSNAIRLSVSTLIIIHCILLSTII